MTRAMVMVITGLFGCAHLPTAEESKGTASLSITPVRYDGRHLVAQFQLEAQGDRVVFDGRLTENIHVYLRKLRDCGSGEEVQRFIMDHLLAGPNPRDFVVLLPGYWYGTTLDFLAFQEPGPPCVDATFTFHSGVKDMTSAGEAHATARFIRTAATGTTK